MSPQTAPATDTDARADDAGSLRRSLGHARLIARVELVRGWRRLRDNRRQLAALMIGGLFSLPMVAGAATGAYLLGTAAGTDAFTAQLSIARMVVTGLAALVAFIVTLATVQEYGELEESAAVLTAVPYRDAVLGLLLLSSATFAGVAAVPILAVAVAFAVGAGSPASAPIIAAVLLSVVAFSTAAGFVLGQAVRTVATRVEFVARYKAAIGVLAFGAYFAVFATGAIESVTGPVFAALESTPLGWFADLALVAAPDTSIGLVRPAAAAGTLLGGTALLAWVAIRLSGALWYSDPVQPDKDGRNDRHDGRNDRHGAAGGAVVGDGEERTRALSTGLSERLFGGRVPRPTLRIAQKSWRRAYRAPLKLQYAAVPAFFMLTPIQQSVESGEVSPILPVLVAIYGAWATGAAFTLNPLGDEGAVLPITLTSGVTGRRLLGGLVFAGSTVGGPATVLLVAALGLASPLDTLSALVIAALGGVLCVGACAIGAGVGTAFPKFEKTRLSRSRRAVVPGVVAFGVYSLALLVVSLPGTLGVIPTASGWLGGRIPVSAQLLMIAGLAATTLLAAVAAWVGLRTAARTIDDYTPAR